MTAELEPMEQAVTMKFPRRHAAVVTDLKTPQNLASTKILCSTSGKNY
jgi:hypothetical protein